MLPRRPWYSCGATVSILTLNGMWRRWQSRWQRTAASLCIVSGIMPNQGMRSLIPSRITQAPLSIQTHRHNWKPRTTARRKVIIALRIILSTAATYLVGLFLWLQQEPEAPVETIAKEHHTEEVNIPCKEGTLMEQAQCYLEQKRNQPKTYSIIKKLLYENQQ